MDGAAAVVSAAWQALFDEVARWRDSGLCATFWWRDDDANCADPALTRLLALSGAAQVPLALAVVPRSAQAHAFEDMPSTVSVLQHGTDHRNRATAGEKKTEFPPGEPVVEALARLEEARAELLQVAGAGVLPVLVPPWNRMASPALMEALPAAGYRALSRFGPRPQRAAAAGLADINTHVDIIDWRGSRGFAGEELLLSQAQRHLQARRSAGGDLEECTGWLTHHLVHDPEAWRFLQQLFERTQALEGLRWCSIAQLPAGRQGA